DWYLWGSRVAKLLRRICVLEPTVRCGIATCTGDSSNGRIYGASVLRGRCIGRIYCLCIAHRWSSSHATGSWCIGDRVSSLLLVIVARPLFRRKVGVSAHG